VLGLAAALPCVVASKMSEPPKRLVSREATSTSRPARELGRSRAAFDLAHASERRACGKRVAESKASAFLFAEAAIEIEAMRAMVHRVAYAIDHRG
jgi:alkylation response protein AidB-like acyl-CoA dehydrogenase